MRKRGYHFFVPPSLSRCERSGVCSCSTTANTLSTPLPSFVVDLLQSVPELAIMCASRRSLGVEGESVYAVEPLPLPSEGADVAELRTVASSHLLAERAAAVDPGFGITTDVPRRRSAVPSARRHTARHRARRSNLRSMTIREVADSVRDRLALGSHHGSLPHHRTLRATILWSHDLLEKPGRSCRPARRVRWSILKNCRSHCWSRSDDLPPSQALASLVEASMLIADVSGRATTYQMLPTMRDFGLSNLRDRGELRAFGGSMPNT